VRILSGGKISDWSTIGFNSGASAASLFCVGLPRIAALYKDAT
jgi:hypothetical protein